LAKIICSLFLVFAVQAQPVDRTAIDSAARKFLPDVVWQPKSVEVADFTCDGRADYAIRGLDPKDIVIAVFIKGLASAPEVIRDRARSREFAKIRIESLDYDPKEILGDDLQGFRRSKTCKGLNLYDDMVDSLHLFWNRATKRFDGWSL
jgi:hypothetical protein